MKAKNGSQILVGIPKAAFDEAPSSWLARAALSQGASMSGLLGHLYIACPADLDFFVLSSQLNAAFEAMGLPKTSLQVSSTILSNVEQLGRSGRNYLLRDRIKPRYRYCSVCFEEQKTNYLPIQWRFKAWQWCPAHDSVLRGACPKCSSFLVLPDRLMNAGKDRAGVASLDRCLNCGFRLSRTASSDRGQASGRIADRWQRLLMSNGRALLAALYYGHIRHSDSEHRHSLAMLRRLSNIIPGEASIFSVHEKCTTASHSTASDK